MDKVYDIIIIGGGPAGLTAGLYAARARMETLLLERMVCGGQVLAADRIENFPGFPEGVRGPDLAEWMTKQAEHFGLKTDTHEAAEIVPKRAPEKPFTPQPVPPSGGTGGIPLHGKRNPEVGDTAAVKPWSFTVKLDDGGELKALALIIATGAKWRSLGIPGEKELAGRGVSYCATCDGPLFRGKEIAVVGGGDTALEDALLLTKFANKVTIVHRRDRLRATKILQERAKANKKIELCLNSVAVEITGKAKVEGIKVSNVLTNKESVIKTDGVFVLIGLTPNSDIIKGVVKLCEKGYVLTDSEMQTSVDGIFACGDVRMKTLRQVVTAAGDGAIAATSAEHYVERLKGAEYV